MELWSPRQPGLDCLVRGHILAEHSEPLPSGKMAWACWCLWCGGGQSNEHEAGWGCGADSPGER